MDKSGSMKLSDLKLREPTATVIKQKLFENIL